MLSNNQWSATLCVRDTCLIVGLLSYDLSDQSLIVFENEKRRRIENILDVGSLRSSLFGCFFVVVQERVPN